MMNLLPAIFQGVTGIIGDVSGAITVLSSIIAVYSRIRQGAKQSWVYATRTASIVAAFALVVLAADITYAVFFKSSTSVPCCTPTVTATVTSTSTPTPNLPPTLENHNFNGEYTNSPLNAVAFPKSVISGDLIIVAITQYQGTVLSVSDSANNMYTRVGVQNANSDPNNDYVELYYAKNVKGGATTITVRFSAAGDTNVGIYEFAHVATLSPLDLVAQKTGFGNAPNGGTLSTVTDNELYFAVGVDDDNSTTPEKTTPASAGSGYILEDHADDSNNEKFYSEYRVAAHGAYQTDFAIALQSDWAVIGASFKQV
jgi:hypothetical protein